MKSATIEDPPGSEEQPKGEDSQVSNAARGTALNLAGSVFGAIISFLTVGVITNAYGTSGSGLFFSATALFTLTAGAGRLGSESSLTFFVSGNRASQTQGAIALVVRHALLVTLIVSGVLGLAGFFGAASLAAAISSDPQGNEQLITMIRILALAVPTLALSQSVFGATRGFGTMKPSVIGAQILRPIAQLLFVAAAIVISDNVWWVAAAWALSSLLTLCYGSVWLRNRISQIEKPPTSFESKDYWRFTAPRAMADLISAALERLDVVLVAIIVGEAGAGLYGASNRLILAGQLMMLATAQSVAPLIRGSFIKGRLDEAQTTLRTLAGWNVAILWPIFLSLLFAAETTLGIFGDEFREAAPVVRVLALGLLAITALGMGDTMLLMTGDSVRSLINHVISLALMVLVAVVLLPEVGIVGAGWAWVVSRIALRLLAVARVWQTKRVHSIGSEVMISGAISLIGFVPTGFVVHGMLQGQLSNGFVRIVVHVLAGGAIHLALLAKFRQTLKLDQLVNMVAKKRG